MSPEKHELTGSLNTSTGDTDVGDAFGFWMDPAVGMVAVGHLSLKYVLSVLVAPVLDATELMTDPDMLAWR